MILQLGSLQLLITIITIFIATTSPTTKAQKSGSSCASSCGIGKAAKVVPYPFGFSNGCPIQLNCNSTEGKIKIDEFQVQNITPNGILINLPADCSRSIETIKPLFGQNYGPSWQNSLLLQNCIQPINGCVISRSPLQRELHSKNCEPAKNDSLSCYTQTYSVSKCNASRYMSGKCGGTTRVVVLVGGIIVGASLMAGLALLCYFVRQKSTSMRNRSSAKRLLCEAAGNSSVPFFQYKEIEKATNGFSEKQRLGTGAYGTVYAGKLHNDDLVAIKKIRHRDTDSIDQVMNEIKLLSSVSHPNLVRLLGCCIEEGEPILVYEFMPNGTLCEHLQRERGNGLPWTIRLTVAAETANAIAYLHSVMNPPIYHRDIKSSNILLDFNYRSKVADFGLSRLGMVETSHVSTAPQGTPGYLDPQYHQYFHLSDKSDVYSFGVVLVEIITAQKVVDFSRPHSEVNLAALAIDRIGRGCVDEIVDPYLETCRDAWTLSSIHSVAELAFRCLAFHGDMRPTMMEVAEELEQIRVSAWAPTMYVLSPSSSSHSSDHGSQKSLGVSIGKKAGVASRRLIVSQRTDYLTLEEVKDSSPVSVQDPWLSEQSSPSTNSLLGNVVH